MRKKTRSELELKITELETKLADERTSYKQQSNERELEWESERQGLTDEVTSLQNEVESRQSQLNSRELKKLASAYSEQENKFRTESLAWLAGVVGTGLILFASIIYIAGLAADKPWYDRFEYYLANFVFATLFIFAIKRHSFAHRLGIDFANRKTLAQSYQNIISVVEDEEIRERFIDKAADVLCAPVDHKTEAYTLPEKIMDTLSDIAKNVTPKNL